MSSAGETTLHPISPGPNPGSAKVSFGPFSLTPSERLLTHDGVPVDLGGRALDILIALTERPGQVMAKADLLERVWPGLTIEAGSLRFHMANLRRALRDGENGARYISTQVGVGYAFVAPVEWQIATPPTAPRSAVPPSPLERRQDASPASTHLPPRTDLIGRDDHVNVIMEQLAAPKLLTIVGTAGLGKTALAVEVGYRLIEAQACPVRFVDLAQLENDALVASAIAAALGLRIQAEDPMVVLLAHLQSDAALLIIDNCEHVIDTLCAVVERIREGAPEVRILATSREPLRALDEHVHWLAPLAFPADGQAIPEGAWLSYPAVELFVRRATAGNTALVLSDDDLRIIGDICRRLEGVALAIELVAIRVASHGVRATDSLLGEQVSLGWAGRRTALPRQQTLWATFDWSYDLLSEVERQVFECLSIFVGAFCMEAAAFVVGHGDLDARTTVRALDALAAKGLVALDIDDTSSSYRLLELTRAYGRERLKLRAAAVSRRHAAYYLARLQSLGTTPQDVFQAAKALGGQLGNIRSALEWSFGPDGDPSVGVPLAAAASAVFLAHSLLLECQTWCRRAVDRLDGLLTGSPVEMTLQAALGLVLMSASGTNDAAGIALRRALELAVTFDDQDLQLRLLGRLHIFHSRLGDYAGAFDWARRAAEVADVLDTAEARAVAAALTGISHHHDGDQVQAARDLDFSIRHSQPYDAALTVHYGFDHRNRSALGLCRAFWILGQADRARHVIAQSEAEAQRLGHPLTHCIALLWSLSVYVWCGDLKSAWANLETFEKSARDNFVRPYLAAVSGLRGAAAPLEAAAELDTFHICVHDSALMPYFAAARGLRGTLAMLEGDADAALVQVDQSLTQLQGMRYDLLTSTFDIAVVIGLTRLGRLPEAMKRVERAIDRCVMVGERFALAELQRLRAGLVKRMRPEAPDLAEAALHEALATSRAQGADAWALRVSLDLASHLIEQARGMEARDCLQAFHGAAMEGADTQDMRELVRVRALMEAG